ncbi:MAG TPA: hypothetical protein DCM68_01390, partial [Verrucomicrobia bacterium]|nr:hypothetical protein [Verrucomicrobiota bacterium]
MPMKSNFFSWRAARRAVAGLCLAGGLWPAVSSGEAMLQFFNASWNEIAEKVPELAEAGYSSIWLPPPAKANGGYSVGYDLFDPFDLGSRDQRGTISTRYGTQADLHNLVELCHRFGIRVYFDNIMNHRAYDVPGYDETTPVDVFPGMTAEDFHLRTTSDGFYRKWDNTRDWQDAWQVMHLGLSDLLDIAHETPNQNFGPTEGSWNAKPSIVRHPDNPEFYDWHPTLGWVGFNSTSITAQVIADNPDFYKEDVGAYLCRNARWMMETTKADGFRLDAVKHVPDYFFGAFGDDGSDAGYLGQVQWQFNKTHGYSDPNHRDSNFNAEVPRDDALLFGEHLGQPPGYDGYVSAGMRLVDNDLRNQLNWRFSAGDLAGYDNAGAGGFSPYVGVMHAQSHDNDYVDRKELQHAYYYLRLGIGLLYTDGNRHAETLSGSGGAFPRWASTAFLGQWGQTHIPELLKIHENGARYTHHGMGTHWDGAVIAWERGGTFPYNTFLTVFNSKWADWRTIPTQGTFPDGAYLYNYVQTYQCYYTNSGPAADYAFAWELGQGRVNHPPNSYSVWGYKNPDPSSLWPGGVVSIYDDGQLADTISVDRKDGPDGDAEFNPNNYGNRGYPDGSTPAPYTYRQQVPRITKGTNVLFTARVDGSADNVLMRLDGGMDLNGTTNVSVDLRDYPPALSHDMVLGFEQPSFVKRIWAEKFAAADSVRNQIGSAGAETYCATVGVAGFTINQSTASNDWDGTTTVSWIYHDPQGTQDRTNCMGCAQFWPPLTNAADQMLYINIKTPKVTGNRVFLYYTANGAAYPEGAGGGGGNSSTRVIEASWSGQTADSNDWWEVVVPAMPAGTVFRYKIGSARQQGYDGNGWDVVWPSNSVAVSRKKLMLGEWNANPQNLKTKSYHKHNDYNSWTTNGLADGFHLLTARAFLGRADGAPVFNTFRQTFYMDTETPRGYIQYPATNETSISGSEYGFIVRTDPSVREVWVHITDSSMANDGVGNGNATNGEVAWMAASSIGAWDQAMAEDTAYPKIWRFNYSRLPAGGSNATIRVRLREWSSTASTNWSKTSPTNDNAAAGHYTEIVRNLYTWGVPEEFFFDWPDADGAMVEAGWQLRIKYTASMAAGLSDQQIFDRVKVYVNSSANGSTERGELVDPTLLHFAHEWNWGSAGEGLNILKFDMPNVYNGQDGWLYGVRVEYTNGIYDKAAVRLVQHRGPLLPTLIITTPPETDSDGAKYVIQMADLPAAVLAANPALRQTPIVVLTDANATNLAIQFNSPQDYVGNVVLDNVATNGDSLTWNFIWTVTNAGAYRFTATVWADIAGTELSSSSNSATRNATVQFRELVSTTNAADADWDDDGMVNTNEVSACPLPATAAEYWTQTDVFNYFSRGKTKDNSPDTDGDGLPDGLELGCRWPADGTDVGTDTDGDGFKNFLPDLDPPFYNTLDSIGTVKDVDGAGTGADRTKRVQGSATDPTNPDSDYDGLPDGIEDANRNGWVDGDGASLPTDWDPFLARNWPDGIINSGETWLETSPGLADSDGDGLSDGYGEDKNFDGLVAGDTDADRVWDGGETWMETDPLNPDTDGDGLPDGWEVRYGLDPLDPTGANGADGNPDGDTYLDVELVEQPYVNLLEYQNGTNPMEPDSIADPGGEGAIVVGQGPVLGTVNGTDYYREFMDWTLDDLIALDNYNQGGNSSDIYRRGDGFDSSRDMVAFYFHDGGAADGKLYFRVDFDDLKASAEQSALNIYVAINFGTYGVGGELNLPDQVNAGSRMLWNACVGVYDGGSGVFYKDTLPGNNTTDIDGNLAAAGVVSVNGVFQGAYFNSDLDAVAWSIDRAALVAAGWNGDPDVLKFQVYTTSDFTGDDGGSGDKGGLNDFTDTIGDDWLCSDYYQDYNYIAANGYYQWCLGRTAGGYVFNNMGQHAKVALLAHGNQAVEPGVTIQNIVDNGSGAGYQRPVKIHNIYSNAALNLHITPTLAMALEWAKVGTEQTWYSGPGLNEQIRAGVAAGTFRLLGSTFSDHILKYFDAAYNLANVQSATDILNEIYGGSPASGVVSTNVFWIPERVADVETLKQVKTNLGFRATILDQTPHLLEWYGREESLADNAYRINRLWLEHG